MNELMQRRRALMGIPKNNEPFMVSQGFINVDATTRVVTLPAPKMSASSHIYYALILAEDFQNYYSQEYANIALGFVRVNNKKNPSVFNTYSYLYTVNSNGTNSDYFSNQTSITQGTDKVSFIASSYSFRVGMKLQYVIIYKE